MRVPPFLLQEGFVRLDEETVDILQNVVGIDQDQELDQDS